MRTSTAITNTAARVATIALTDAASLELHGEAARSEGVAEALRTNYRALQDGLRRAIKAAQGHASVDPALDPAGTAILITAPFEGVERAAACDPDLDQKAAGRSLAVLLRRSLVTARSNGLGSPDVQHRKIRLHRNTPSKEV